MSNGFRMFHLIQEKKLESSSYDLPFYLDQRSVKGTRFLQREAYVAFSSKEQCCAQKGSLLA